MQETIELRIPETDAQKHLQPDEGVVLGGSVRKIELGINDGRLHEIAQIEEKYRAKGDAFFTAWIPHRRYTKKEINEAGLFNLIITAIFEPAGEECGTFYDESKVCKRCGANGLQMSDLFIDSRRLPKSKAIAKTIAEEIVVSERVATLLKKNNMKGCQFKPVHDKKSPKSPIPWFQLKVTSSTVHIVPPTRIGNNPFDMNSEGKYRCPFGHVLGLNVLSEIWVSKVDWDGSDFLTTAELIGVRRGLLRPFAPVFFSPRVRNLLRKEGIRGFKTEVAHFA